MTRSYDDDEMHEAVDRELEARDKADVPDNVTMIGRENGFRKNHQHEAWQLDQKVAGGYYCKACGGDVSDEEVAVLKVARAAWLQRNAEVQATLAAANEQALDLSLEEGKGNALLDEVIEERRAVYGEPIDTFPRVAQIWSGILGHEVNPVDVPLMLIGYKLLRAAVTPDYSDNSDDVEGYLAIFRELVGPDMIKARSVDEYLVMRRGLRDDNR